MEERSIKTYTTCLDPEVAVTTVKVSQTLVFLCVNTHICDHVKMIPNTQTEV